HLSRRPPSAGGARSLAAAGCRRKPHFPPAARLESTDACRGPAAQHRISAMRTADDSRHRLDLGSNLIPAAARNTYPREQSMELTSRRHTAADLAGAME